MLEKKTISDYVYDKILEGIVQLTYAPGSHQKCAGETGKRGIRQH